MCLFPVKAFNIDAHWQIEFTPQGSQVVGICMQNDVIFGWVK